MKDVSKYMDFDVYTDRSKSKQYNITVTLESEVSSQAREAAIALAGAIVRNYFSGLYKDINTDKELAELIKSKLNGWVPTLVANNVNVEMKRAQSRAA